MTVYLVNERKEKVREFDDKETAEEQRDKLIGLGMQPQNVEIRKTHPDETKTDGGETEVVEATEPNSETQAQDETIPETQPSVDEDPVEWMPSHFVDSIQGVPTVNRKGYAVISSQYNVSVTAEPVTLASETDFTYAEFKAVAETADGQEYSGFGSAHVDRQDGDDEHLLNELAETRAMKRAVAWATGVGMTAVEELQNKL